MSTRRAIPKLVLLALVLMLAPLALAQQTGSISGKVTATDGSLLPGVTVQAKSTVMPKPRIATTGGNGEYRLPALQPGTYTVDYSLSGMKSESRSVVVSLDQDVTVNVTLGVGGVSQTITVTATTSLTDPESTAIRSSLSDQMIQQLPLGQEYRDLLKLAPAIQYNEAAVRGPAAGGSEQDNVYKFDGVNVTLPLFGTLAAEPSSQDIQQVSIIKGGAKAMDFNRSAGFTVDSVSKSGTSEFLGTLEYQFQNSSMAANSQGVTAKNYNRDRAWITAAFGGPILKDRLFFYASGYRPTATDSNSATVYGPVPDYKSTRNEGFAKLTWTPTSSILINGSFRGSKRTVDNASISGFEAPSVALGEESRQNIGILEGSWVINNHSFASFKYTDYGLKTSSLPDNILSVTPSAQIGAQLDTSHLDQMGYFAVPSPGADPAYNAFVTPIINTYGYMVDGVPTGGGYVGGGLEINQQNFFRTSAQAAYNISLGQTWTHDLHFGIQQDKDAEDLARSRNGWGAITVPGGLATCPTGSGCDGQPVYYQAQFQRSNQGSGLTQVIHSEIQTTNLEFNDTIRHGNWAYNVGVLASRDELYGQGLKVDSSALSGYVADPGHKYLMHTISFGDQIQPRLGVTWAYNGHDTLYASYARYNPAASSLPRAASWDRNTLGLRTRAYFDQNGVEIGSEQVSSSSGKLFEAGIKPRYTDEFMIGTAKDFSNGISARFYTRYRYSSNFWEDTPNTARTYADAPANIANLGLYIPDLNAYRNQIGSGSSYVIALLNGAFTKYYEATTELDWRVNSRFFVRGTYTWSHYYGNFDQDNTSTTYDFATFIGSSNIADGPGRQVWNNKYGNLHADVRDLVKIYGMYQLNWNASVGLFGLFQTGQHWETWSYVPYRLAGLYGGSSSTDRYAEPAGSRTTPSHYQFDLNYTQNFPIRGNKLQLVFDIFNLTNQQTGYAPYPVCGDSTALPFNGTNASTACQNASYGTPRLSYAPRRLQVAARFEF